MELLSLFVSKDIRNLFEGTYFVYRAFVRNLKQDAIFLDPGSYDVTLPLHPLPAYLPSNLSLRWLYSRSEMSPLS